ncbi:MAG TPA: YihY/virulence factor BrkB family protein [Kofleriaceae bacterium]|nr:YihY/virulence factor BrkB family protein [Kofleriaceae bacterium]
MDGIVEVTSRHLQWHPGASGPRRAYRPLVIESARSYERWQAKCTIGRRDPKMMPFLRRLSRAIVDDAIDDVGAMMAYYAMLAVFPLLLFVVTLAALALPGHMIDEGARLALESAPRAARSVVTTQVENLTRQARVGFAFGTMLFALWGASRGASGLMVALNRLFRRVERRSWLRRQAIAIGLTIAVTVLLLIALGLLVLGPLLGHVVAQQLGLGGAFEIGWTLGRWVGAGLLVMVVWALAYRFLPDTDAPFRIFTPGALVSVVLWLAISRLFGLYLDHVTSQTSIYGALGSAVIVLIWLWLSSMALLFAAEINEVLAATRGTLQREAR